MYSYKYIKYCSNGIWDAENKYKRYPVCIMQVYYEETESFLTLYLSKDWRGKLLTRDINYII